MINAPCRECIIRQVCSNLECENLISDISSFLFHLKEYGTCPDCGNDILYKVGINLNRPGRSLACHNCNHVFKIYYNGIILELEREKISYKSKHLPLVSEDIKSFINNLITNRIDSCKSKIQHTSHHLQKFYREDGIEGFCQDSFNSLTQELKDTYTILSMYESIECLRR